MHTLKPFVVATVIFVGSSFPSGAQQPAAPSAPPTTPYGSPISLDAAKKVMAAAEAEATKNNWPMEPLELPARLLRKMAKSPRPVPTRPWQSSVKARLGLRTHRR